MLKGGPLKDASLLEERCVSALEYRRCGLHRLDLAYTTTTLPILCVQQVKHVDIRVAIAVYLIEFTVRAGEGVSVENAPIWYLSVCHVVIVMTLSHPHFPRSRTQNLASRHRTTWVRFLLFEMALGCHATRACRHCACACPKTGHVRTGLRKHNPVLAILSLLPWLAGLRLQWKSGCRAFARRGVSRTSTSHGLYR